jgi:hypothetical protein
MTDRLEKLWPHLGNMTPDELRQQIIRIRAERRLIKMKSATKTARQTSDTAKAKARKLLADMDPATMAKMLKDLEP